VGLRFYPGASGENGGRGGVRRDSPGAWAVVELTTPDPFDKVVAFYRSAYGRGNQVVRRGDSFIIILPGPEHVKTVTVTRGKGVSLTRIMLSYGRP
jgi:hypothetical protein